MKKPLVSIIDDDDIVKQVIERRLIKLGCEVRVFKDPQVLIQSLQENPPQLLIVDLDLGAGFSGLKLIRQIRSIDPINPPIIILSCERDQAQITQGIELGANDYIIKPPNRYDFEETISKWVQFDTARQSSGESFQFVHPDQGKVKLSFRAWITEVNAKGFTLAVDHLIKKSATFYICGSEIKKITPSFDRLLVTVTHSTSKIISDQPLYLLQLEIDPSHQQALNEIRVFLATQFSESRSAAIDRGLL